MTKKTRPVSGPQVDEAVGMLSFLCLRNLPLGMHTAVEAGNQWWGWWHAVAQLEGLALSARVVVGVSHRAGGWHHVFLQPERPELVASAVLEL